MARRAIDIAIAVLALVLSSPLLAAAGLVILATMGAPVLFRQRRAGLGGRGFVLLKFRTMTVERDGQDRLLPDESRLTAPGRFFRRTSLDELPQLWNVLKGDMSVVGPRPLLPEYLPRYSEHQRRRHEVKPGITGWAQVNGRNALTWEQKLNLDVWYVDHRSPGLDIRILWLTLLRVWRRDGISQNGHATMPEFMGTASAAERHE